MASLLIFATLLLCSTANEIQQPDVMHEGESSGFAVVSYASFGPVTEDTNIPFTIVESNIGDAWSGVTNSYMAPTDGFYLFTASIGSSLGNPCSASIVVTTGAGSRRVASMSTSSSGPTGGSNQVILTLATGNQVSVQLHAGAGSTLSSPDEVFVTFSGLRMNNVGATPFHEGDPVGFSGRSNTGFGPVTLPTNMPFPIIEVSLQGWNPTTNQFQAPIQGAYLFTASVGSADGQRCAASIVHSTTTGSRRVASLVTASEGEKGDFNSILLMLQQGDYVSVQLHPDGGATHSSSGDVMSTFTGVLMSNPGAAPPY